MDRIHSTDLHLWALAYHIDLGRVLVVAVKIGLASMITGSLMLSMAVRAGIASDFVQQIALDEQHIVMIHSGPIPTCIIITNPPHHHCFWPSPEGRKFSVNYLTPHGVSSLVWFRLPSLDRARGVWAQHLQQERR